ncbi:Rv3212 family protein [Amycolatopsis sp. w19]|uniref:Rv3212 family protein n=1 Tax=Amycolatopsis sp. w19 TaxID=3448134 RepID=UPI003F197A06
MSERWDAAPDNEPARPVPADPEQSNGSEPETAENAIGTEDVLDADPAQPVATEPPLGGKRARPSPWNRKRDRVMAAAIVVVVAVTGVVIGVTSDNAATVAQVATTLPPGLPPAPAQVPGSLSELWQAPSASTPVPIGEANSVVTADKGEVLGRDPYTGEVRWRYSRDLELCTVALAGIKVDAVYRKDTGCSEVTQLDAGTGRRTAQRNGDAELGTRLVVDGSHVTTTGKKLLNTWRDDLVKSMEYGQVPAIVNPNKQPRTGCTYGTVAAAAGKIGVIERCPGDPADRFTVYRATNDEADDPKVDYSTVLAGKNAKVVAMSGDLALIVLPEQKLLVIYGGDGLQKSAYPLDLPEAEITQDPVGGVMTTSWTAQGVYWFTGSKTMAFSRDDLTPRWTLNNSTGPGVTFGEQLVVPIQGGLAVLDEATGATIRTVGVDRRGYTGPVLLSSVGPVLLEQRGPTVVALK